MSTLPSLSPGVTGGMGDPPTTHRYRPGRRPGRSRDPSVPVWEVGSEMRGPPLFEVDPGGRKRGRDGFPHPPYVVNHVRSFTVRTLSLGPDGLKL